MRNKPDMADADNFDQEFREIFLNHLKVIHNKELDRFVRTELRPKIREMILSKMVSRMTVVATIIESLKLYPDKADYVLDSLLSHIIHTGDLEMTGTYPELLWLVHDSGLTNKRDTAEDMFDIAQILVRIIGHKLARSYLTYLLLTSPREKAKIIIPAYYYTHHDIESLRLVIPYISYNDPNLSGIIHTSAVIFVANLQEKQLSRTDTDFLVEFFQKYLTSENTSVYELSKKSIEKLKQAISG